MTFSGNVTKALLIVTPAWNTAEHAADVRHALYEGGFIVVREEERTLTREVAERVAACDGPVAASIIVGRCLVIVVARTDASDRLNEFRNTHPHPDALYCCQKALDAQRAVQFLFPKMIVDPIPTNGEARDYIQAELKAAIIDGLTEVAKQKPENAVEYFARFLLEHNPNSPPVTLKQ